MRHSQHDGYSVLRAKFNGLESHRSKAKDFGDELVSRMGEEGVRS